LLTANAQPFENDWIVSSQTYFKLSTAEDGIYRLTYQELASAGFPVSRDPRNIQIFHRGKEHAFVFSNPNSSAPGQNDGVFDPDDYIEFYGKKNDGTLDEQLYVSPDAHKNKYYNFYSDTTAYFLTWSLNQAGKRVSIFKENNILNLPPEEYHNSKQVKVYTNNYAYGLRYPEGQSIADTYLSAFDYGEGWTGQFFGRGQSRDVSFQDMDNAVTSGPKPQLEILLTGGNNNAHNVDILVGPEQNNLRLLKKVSFSYMRNIVIQEALEWTDISNGNLFVRVLIPDIGVAERVAISYATLVYAGSFDHESLEQREYNLMPTLSTNRSYIEIENVPSASMLLDITDETNIALIDYNVVGSSINAVLPNDSGGRRLLLTSKQLQVPKIQAVSMRTVDPSKVDYVIITNKKLRTATANYPDPVKAYANYRASPAGGGYDTLLINIDQLYNMFSYGEYSSLAIYRFCDYLATLGDPKYLFIVGKGLSGPHIQSYRNGTASNPTRDLVPTAGFPGTDALYTAGLKGTTFESGFPVGRVAAESPNQVAAYFEKVKEIENVPHSASWRKELIHLSGGKSFDEQYQYRTYVDGFKSIAEGQMLGGYVETVSKTSTGATEEIFIPEQVNSGKMLVTFFGHSGAVGTDIDIGKVSESERGYANKGKYPMLLVNGCNAGDMFRNSTSNGFGEDWILTPEKGAVGFIAHTNNGFDFNLQRYSNIFYEVAFTDSIYLTKGIGDIQKETAKRYLARYSHSETNITQAQQMALHGDPAVTLFGVSHPDYEINPDNIFVRSDDGQPINAFTEQFSLGLVVNNFGSTHNDSIKISVNRTLSNGAKQNIGTFSFKPVYFKDTLYVPVNSAGIEGYGINMFSVTIDSLNEIVELSKSNNSAQKEIFINLGGTANVYPSNYSIVNQTSVKLKVSSLDLLAENKTFLFEMDTTNSFDIPLKKTTISGDVLAEWQVDLFDDIADKDTVVFYWRTIFADDTTGIWSTTSFTYIKDGLPGWAMTHFPQFEGNEKSNLALNMEQRQIEFETTETSLSVRTFGNDHPEFGQVNVELKINNTQYIIPTARNICANNSITLTSFRKTSTLPYLVIGTPAISDPLSCGIAPQSINSLSNGRIQNNLLIEQYIDRMGDGDFVVLFSIGNVTFQSWPATTISKLAEIGVNKAEVENLLDGEPLIILGKKGTSPGYATVITADYSSPVAATEQEVALNEVINGKAVSGTLRSPKIGPAAAWVSFHQRNFALESPSNDDYNFDIIGIDNTNNEVILFEDLSGSELNLSNVNTAMYPYLRLEMGTKDDVDLTPTQLENWFVLYDGFPEGILSMKEEQLKKDIELFEGSVHESSFVFTNISDLPFKDSIAVTSSLFNQSAGQSFRDTIMVKPLAPEESVDFSFTIETNEKVGKNDFNVFANPYIQNEQNYNNNFINLPDFLLVQTDNTNPILEVTVDGEFIMDGDIVSPSPSIVLRMKDENTTLLKQDTLGINLYLNESCEGCSEKRISFSSPNLVWTPATADSEFMVEYQPENLTDGIYRLQAEASDASGNSSGAERYAVNFEIVNESQITNFFPYPNPFSSRTQFVFTLTGGDLPDEIIIQIMTVNGTVVREITQDEMGPLKIGHNKTEYAWDGRDEYGDQLANGVYLYKVKIFNNGVEMKHRSTSADRAFKNGIGKIYLLR